jgi:hypothetical protein
MDDLWLQMREGSLEGCASGNSNRSWLKSWIRNKRAKQKNYTETEQTARHQGVHLKFKLDIFLSVPLFSDIFSVF